MIDKCVIGGWMIIIYFGLPCLNSGRENTIMGHRTRQDHRGTPYPSSQPPLVSGVTQDYAGKQFIKGRTRPIG